MKSITVCDKNNYTNLKITFYIILMINFTYSVESVLLMYLNKFEFLIVYFE